MLNGASKTVSDDQENGQTGTDAKTRLADLEQQIEALKKQLARGTQDNIVPPPEEPKPQPDILDKIEQTLRSQICTTEELARIIHEPLNKVQEKLKTIRKHLADIGTPDQARWVWRIGDDTSATELKALVARLIEGRAMTTAELTKITGARMPRVNGVLVELQREMVEKDGKLVHAVAIYNLGSDFRAKWIIIPKTARPANLPPKASKK